MNHLYFMTALCCFVSPQKEWKLNTSNLSKLEEFQRFFGKKGYKISSTQIDLPEIDASPIDVVLHKASQVEEWVLIEDTSLEIEGADVGVNVRWLLDNLSDYIGRKARWTTLIAYREGSQVHVYKGEVKGTIVKPAGTTGFGFDPVFQPEFATQTLAQSKPDHVNARALAVEALLNDKPLISAPAITEWHGPWQKH